MNKISLNELLENLTELFTIKKINNLLITNDMGKFGLIENKKKNETQNILFSIIKKLIPDVTIVVPTANLNLPNTGKNYDNLNTPSYKMGSFSEFIRKLPNSDRSFHPLWSMSAYGKNSKNILSNIPIHAYSYDSVMERLFKNEENYFLSIGQHPRYMLPIVHHLEHINEVPYRFEKTFSIICRENEYQEYEEKKFKLDVLKEKYRQNKRAHNNLIFSNFESKGQLIKKNFNNTEIYLFNMIEFFELTNALFKKDINCWWK